MQDKSRVFNELSQLCCHQEFSLLKSDLENRLESNSMNTMITKTKKLNQLIDTLLQIAPTNWLPDLHLSSIERSFLLEDNQNIYDPLTNAAVVLLSKIRPYREYIFTTLETTVLLLLRLGQMLLYMIACGVLRYMMNLLVN